MKRIIRSLYVRANVARYYDDSNGNIDRYTDLGGYRTAAGRRRLRSEGRRIVHPGRTVRDTAWRSRDSSSFVIEPTVGRGRSEGNEWSHPPADESHRLLECWTFAPRTSAPEHLPLPSANHHVDICPSNLTP